MLSGIERTADQSADQENDKTQDEAHAASTPPTEDQSSACACRQATKFVASELQVSTVIISSRR